MRALIRCVLIAQLVTLAAPAPGEGIDASLRAEATYGAATDQSLSVAGELLLLPSLDMSLGEATSLVTSVRLRADAEDFLEPGRANTDTFSHASKPVSLGDAGTIELLDAYLEWRGNDTTFRVGKQQIVWGRLDGLKILDLLNPQDFREFILDDFPDSRISLWSAYVDGSIAEWRAELALIPDATGHAIPNPGAWFELQAPRFRFGAPSSAPSPIVITDRPGVGIDESAAGLRLSRELGRTEVSLVAYTGIDPEPLGRIVSAGGAVAVERYYERRDAFGLSAERSIGPLVVRAEYAYQPDRVFNVRDGSSLSAVPLDQHRGAIAIDWSAPFDIFLNAQYLIDRVDEAPASLVRPDVDRIGTLFARKDFGYDRFSIELRWYHSFSEGDDMGAATFRWRVADNTTLMTRLETFSGTQDGLFGQFDDRGRALIGIEHIF